jgi:hypothetical protein
LYTHDDPVNGIDSSGEYASLAGAIGGMAIRGAIGSVAIGAIFRVPLMIYQVINGKELGDALLEMTWGLTQDAVIGALLGGGAYGAVRMLGTNTVKLRALGQSIFSIKAARLPGSAWLLEATKRGLKIEQAILGRAAGFLGRQIKNFPVIDDYVKIGGKGVATSVKSMDLLDDSYQVASQITSKLRSAAKYLQNLTTASRNGFTVGNVDNPIHQKVLIWAFEVGTASAAQAKVITKFLQEAPILYPDIKVVIQFLP